MNLVWSPKCINRSGTDLLAEILVTVSILPLLHIKLIGITLINFYVSYSLGLAFTYFVIPPDYLLNPALFYVSSIRPPQMLATLLIQRNGHLRQYDWAAT